jgi:hypothetical protein
MCCRYVQFGPATSTAAPKVGAHLTKLSAFLELERVTRDALIETHEHAGDFKEP